jgi:ankyrin repeat protein
LWKIPYNGKGEPEKRVVMIKRAAKLARYSQEVKIIGSSDGNHSKVGYGLTRGSSQEMNVDQTHTYISFPPTLLWFAADKIGEGMQNGRELALFEDTQVISGHGTTAFWKLANRKGSALPRHELCFSVVATTRSLDVAAETVSEAEEWKKSLDTLLEIFKPINERTVIENQENLYSQQLLNLGVGEGQSTPPPPPTQHSKTSPIFRHAPPVVSSPQDEMDALQQEALTKQMFAAANACDNLQLSEVLGNNIPVNIMEPATFDTPLMICVRNGNAEGTQLCLDYGARNDPHPDFGQTALHAGVDAGQYNAVVVLMEAAAESQADSIISNLADPSGQTPLHLSSLRGNDRILELLLTHGADISRVDDKGQTSLHVTCAAGHKSCLAVLLDHGGDTLLEETDNNGNCCLHYAAMYGRLACVRLLLETAAEVMTRNNRGLTPYNLASVKGHHQVGLLLLDYQDSAAADITSTPLKTPSKLNTNYNDVDDDENEGSDAFTIGIRDVPKDNHRSGLALKNPHELSNIALPRPHTSNSPLVSNHKSYVNSPLTSNTGYHVVSSQRPQTARTSNDIPLYSPNNAHSARERPTPNLFDGMQVNNKQNQFKAKEQGIGSSFNNNNNSNSTTISTTPTNNNYNQLSPSPSAYVDAFSAPQQQNHYLPTPGNDSLNDSYNQQFYSPLPHPNHISKGHSPDYGNFINDVDNQQNQVEDHEEEYYGEENDIEFIGDISEAVENFLYDNVSWSSYYTGINK